MTKVEASVEHYLSEFSSLEPHLPGRNLPWVREARERALEAFTRIGFPTPREEDWKYTRVTPIEKRSFRTAVGENVVVAPDDLDRHRVPGLDAHRLAFVDGRYCAPLSSVQTPRGVTVTSLAAALTETPDALEPHLGRYASITASGFSALNTAFLGEGAFVHIDADARIDEPVLLLFISTGRTDEVCAQPRALIIAERGSQATVIEQYVCVGETSYFNNAITEVALGPNSGLEHYKLQEESGKAFHISTLQVYQGRDSRFTSHSVSLGGALVRNDINSVLDAEGAECELNGLYLATGRQHVDFHTRIDHRKPHGTSREFYNGVLAGRSRGVFNGRVYVHPHAQKTDAEQVNNNLLLSRDAEIDTKPQLEIFADDVKCSHGATVGQLDEDMVFYLRSRGITESAARGLLTYGFASDVIQRMSLAAVRAKLEEQLIAWLPNPEQVKEIVT